MSWKSFVCAGLLCALVSPAWALPSVDLCLSDGALTNSSGCGGVGDPVLNGSGNLEWYVYVLPDADASMAAELAFTAVYGGLQDISVPNSDWDHANPATDGVPSTGFTFWDSGTGGAQQGTGGEVDNAFIAMGSDTLSNGVPSLLAVLETLAPVTNSSFTTYDLTTEINVYGGYETDTMGRLVQEGLINTCGTNPELCNIISDTASYSVVPADANLDGGADIGDLAIWKNPFGVNWDSADFDDNGSVDIGDLAIWKTTPNTTLPPLGAGGGAVAATVPEPSSLVLALFFGLALASARRVR